MKCPHCGKDVDEAIIIKEAAAAMGRISSPAKTAAARENASKPRPGAQGKKKPRKSAV